MNYTQLVAAIESYTENQFETADINTFIQEAEQRIYNSVQLPALRKNVIGTLTSGNKYLTCPTDWLATFSLALINNNNEFSYLLDKDVNFIRASYPDVDAAYYGTPEYYAQFDQNTFILGPTPDANYSMELHYFYYPVSIVQGMVTILGTLNAGTGYISGVYANVPLTGGSGTNLTATFVVVGTIVTSVTIDNGGLEVRGGLKL